MKIIKDNNGVPQDYSIAQLKADNPNTSFRRGHPDSQINQFGVYRVQPTAQPIYDNMIERLEAGTPVKVVDDWIEVWNIVPLSQADIDAKAISKSKAKREKDVDALVVTTSGGKTFDGDEKSQARMTRAIVMSQSLETTLWKLADNTIVEVTREELQEALRLSGEAQTAVWFGGA